MGKSDGRQLEQFVAFVEETLVPKGFQVKSNRKAFDHEGNQLAEFDIVVRGKVGTAKIAWLIECRDRPSEGAAPGSWIDQLVGRRARFNFNKVTAVSTTGFSASARDSAAKGDIELRELSEMGANEFDWILAGHLTSCNHLHALTYARINIVDEVTSAEVKAALAELFSESASDTKLLVANDETLRSVQDVFVSIMKQSGTWEKITPGAPPTNVRARANFEAHDRFRIETTKGTAVVHSIDFIGALSIEEALVPAQTFRYRHSISGEVISEVVSFSLPDTPIHAAIEIHKIAGADTMPVILRALGDKNGEVEGGEMEAQLVIDESEPTKLDT